jgi:hypothetical protein
MGTRHTIVNTSLCKYFCDCFLFFSLICSFEYAGHSVSAQLTGLSSKTVDGSVQVAIYASLADFLMIVCSFDASFTTVTPECWQVCSYVYRIVSCFGGRPCTTRLLTTSLDGCP